MNRKQLAQDADDDNLFYVPEKQVEQALQAPKIDPFESISEKNRILEELKQKNKAYRRDPTQVVVSLAPSTKQAESLETAETVVKNLFSTNK